jgi:GTP-binding protein
MPSPNPRPPRVIDAQFTAGASRVEQLPAPQHLEVAFAGRSNVGKSSLMNALLERKKLVRTSGTPGCTRQISLFDVTTRLGSRLTLVDLPGYGYAKRSHTERREWADLIHTYLLQRPALALLVALVDIRRGLEADDEQLLELISQTPRASRAPVEIILVATKLDKLPGSERKLALTKLKAQTPRPWIGFSTELPETHDLLWRQIMKRLDLDQPRVPEAAAPASDVLQEAEQSSLP